MQKCGCGETLLDKDIPRFTPRQGAEFPVTCSVCKRDFVASWPGKNMCMPRRRALLRRENIRPRAWLRMGKEERFSEEVLVPAVVCPNCGWSGQGLGFIVPIPDTERSEGVSTYY